MKNFNHSIATAVIALGVAQPVFAEKLNDRGGEKSATQSPGAGDIIVTARRSSERLQDVPIAVTAFTSDFLERQNVKDATALPDLTPNLTVAPQPSSLSAATVFIRGIGNGDPATVSEQGVGIYLDGVYLARSAGAIFDLLDMERVEVLRGPQGTLFGRNTIGGAIQFVTKKPSDEMHMDLKAGYGSYGDWNVRGRLDTGYIAGSPIKLALSAGHREADGYVDNTLAPDSKDPGAIKSDSIALALQADLGALTVNYNYDYNDKRGTPVNFQVIAATPDVRSYFGASPIFGGSEFVVSPNYMDTVRQEGFEDRSGKYRFDSRTKVSGHGLTLTYDVSPSLTLKSITGYRDFSQDSILSLSGNAGLLGVVLDPLTFAPSIAPVTLYNGNAVPMKQRQTSEEIQALGEIGDFSYLAGLYYFDEKTSESNRQALTFVLPGGAAGFNLRPVQAFSGKSESKAAFGQLSWKPSALAQKLELTAGLRYTEDEKSIDLRGDVVPNLEGNVKDDNMSWLLSASYKLSGDVMMYTRVSTGYHAGGVNPRSNVINKFDPEEVTAYEVGVKSSFLDRRVRLNLAGYISDYKDLQVNQFAAGSGGATSVIVNAGKVQLIGFEAEAVLMPMSGLIFEASAGYIHPDYKEFLFRDPLTNVLIDVSSQAKLTYSPEWSLHFAGEYSRQVPIGLLRMRADYSYRSEIYFNTLDITTPFNEELRSRADRNLKARVSLEEIAFQGGKLQVGVWGDNLTDNQNIAYGIDFGALGFAGATFKKPLTAGLDVKFSY